MEEKPATTVAAAGAESPASAEPASSRRRAGGHKRKANALSTSSSSSTPSKRLTREKAAISQSPIHNGGPLTRARQSPNNLASSASSAAAGFKLQEKLALAVPETAILKAAREELIRLEELKASIDADFEVIRSRESNAHVVPNHCGWFSWTKIHPLEERTLPSFFNGKSQIRTPDTYLEIRNWIVKKFHKNPDVQIELKDMSELEVADLDARQEVLEFLDYWGLINFHPSPQIDSTANIDDCGVAEKELLLEKLFRFENIQPSAPVVSKPNLSTPVVASRLFPESSLAEELVTPEYHCNSCSADCSRKRYHCQKQADYDLCANCFSNRKFASNMSSSDFILMEPAEAPGLSGGKWTDQETLLLLEALELYKENWNEIAEHVATKTKAQCILHFLQMPIEDVFFDEDSDLVGPSTETTDLPAVTDDASVVPRDGTETNEDKTTAKDQPRSSLLETPKPEDGSDGHQESVKPDNSCPAIIDEETLKTNNEAKAAQEASEKFAVKALTEAFEGAGYHPAPENKVSFAEVGNPVMALAAFLGNLVGSDVAAASACSSLKSLNSNSPGMLLATRHCFLLEDPPDEQKESAGLYGSTIEMALDAPKDNQDNQTQKGDETTSVLDGGDVSKDHYSKKDENATPEKNGQPDSSNDVIEKVNAVNEAGVAITTEEVKPSKLDKSIEPELQKDPESRTPKESNEKSSMSECAPSSVEEEEPSKAIHSQLTDASMDVNMVPDSISSENIEACQSVPSKDPSQAANASKEAVDNVSNPLPGEKNEEQKQDHSQPTESQHDVDMMSPQPQPSESKEPQQPVAPDHPVENGATKAEGLKDDKNEKPDCKNLQDEKPDCKNLKDEKPDYKNLKHDHPIDKLKRAALSALSAAAVKAKVLANQEEEQIRQLAASLVEKQLHKLETKVAFFNEMDHLIMRVREQLDRSRQKLYHERAQIIAARLGLPPSSPRPMPPALPTTKVSTSLANAIPRPSMGISSQKPPVSRPMGTMPPTAPSNPFVSTATAGNPVGPSGQETK